MGPSSFRHCLLRRCDRRATAIAAARTSPRYRLNVPAGHINHTRTTRTLACSWHCAGMKQSYRHNQNPSNSEYPREKVAGKEPPQLRLPYRAYRRSQDGALRQALPLNIIKSPKFMHGSKAAGHAVSDRQARQQPYTSDEHHATPVPTPQEAGTAKQQSLERPHPGKALTQEPVLVTIHFAEGAHIITYLLFLCVAHCESLQQADVGAAYRWTPRLSEDSLAAPTRRQTVRQRWAGATKTARADPLARTARA